MDEIYNKHVNLMYVGKKKKKNHSQESLRNSTVFHVFKQTTNLSRIYDMLYVFFSFISSLV